MMPDHYATLGVDPTANAKTIRAAYLGLMREYHPDRNPSPEATLWAQAAIAAFKVLGDFDRRNQYDWDRRREREAAAAPAGQPRRRIGAGWVAAGAIGLAALGLLSSIPTPAPSPEPTAPPAEEVRQAAPARAPPAARPNRVAEASPAGGKPARPATVAPPVEPVRVATIEPAPPGPATTGRAPTAVRPVAEAAAKSIAPVVPAAQAKATPRPVRRAADPAATDLASLDQFVMSFYGQSWRFGDPPRRAVLEKTRASFVAQRGACTADPCKRSAYLKLMRDVSDIVASGQPKTR